jgi:predicted 2-oxoglutarate/Fe(II)-dependent dioxygenase YbiX
MPKTQSDYIPKIESKASPLPNDVRFNALSTSRTKETGAKVSGEVVAADRATPVSNAKLVFVNATDLDDRRFVTADTFGGFDAQLPAGDWIVYAGRGTGKADKISTFRVADGERVQPTVVLK